MKLAALLLLLSCKPTGEQRSNERMSELISPTAQCIHERGKYSDLTFCMNGRDIVICNEFRCISTTGEKP